MRSIGTMALAAMAAVGLAACDAGRTEKRQVLNVVSGRVALAATPDRPSAGYLTVLGGAAPVDLVAVTTQFAGRAEMHETVKENGVVSMREVRRVPIPAQGRVAFQPGGRHIMLWNVDPRAVQAGKLPMVFVFSNNQRIQADLRIEQGTAAGKDAHAGH